MLLLRNLTLFGFLCRQAEFTLGTLLRWDKASRQILPPKDRKGSEAKLRRACWRVFGFLLTVALQHAFPIGGSRTAKSEDLYQLSVMDIMITAISISSQIWSLALLVIYLTKSSIIAAYINGHIQLSLKLKDETKEQLTLLEIINLLYAYSSPLCTTTIALFLLYGGHFNDPCKPTLAGYWMIAECWPNSAKNGPTFCLNVWNVIAKAFVFLINQYIFNFMISVYPLACAGLLSLSTLSFRLHLVNWKKSCKRAESSAKQYESSILYRNIQIMVNMMNDIQRHGITGLLISIIIPAQAITLVCFIRLDFKADNVIPIVFCIVTIFSCISILFGIVGAQSTIFTTSEEVLQILSQDAREQKSGTGLDRRWRQRFYRSCPIVKVGFGSLNFIDRLTPLTCVDFANDLTVNFLLAFQ